MSFWDRYLAPGDIRHQRQLEEAAARAKSSLSSTTTTNTLPTPPPRIDAAHRARRQNAIFYGGLGFTFLSLFITRRALRRRNQPKLSTTPNGTTSTSAGEKPGESKVEGAFEAVEALFLATANVAAFGMAALGGFMKLMDIADVEDLRETVRKGVGYDVYGGESEADKEMEEWIADVLSRKEEGGLSLGGLRQVVAGKLGEMVEEDRRAKEARGEGVAKVVEVRVVEERKKA